MSGKKQSTRRGKGNWKKRLKEEKRKQKNRDRFKLVRIWKCEDCSVLWKASPSDFWKSSKPHCFGCGCTRLQLYRVSDWKWDARNKRIIGDDDLHGEKKFMCHRCRVEMEPRWVVYKNDRRKLKPVCPQCEVMHKEDMPKCNEELRMRAYQKPDVLRID